MLMLMLITGWQRLRMHRNAAHAHRLSCKHLELRPVAGHLRQNPLEALVQGEAMLMIWD